LAKKDPRVELTPLERLRKACIAMPGCEEKLSHGDGHIAACLPAAPGAQEEMIAEAPETFYRPPYVGCRRWVGVELARIGDEELAKLVSAAWRIVSAKKR